MKIITIVGTRPNLIKVPKLKNCNQIIVHTGQHYDSNMSDVFFKGLKIKNPKYNLGVTKIGEMIDGLIPILKNEKPNYLMVIGDVNSTLAGAIAAEQCNIPIIHLEAGIRSHDTSMIEERNRIAIDSMSSILLCPSQEAMENLRLEGKGDKSFFVGAAQLDTMYSTFPTTKPEDAYQYCFATIHRDFNVDDRKRLGGIIRAFKNSGERIKLPLHPRTAKRLRDFGLKFSYNVEIIKPLPYKEAINMMAFAKKIITDSGGIQVEAYFLRVPCITVRPNTEWAKTVDEGWNILINDSRSLCQAIKTFNISKGSPNSMAYGLGNTFDLVQSLIEGLK